MNDHRFSGWPGAWCFDCGIEDQTEICLAEHDVILYCLQEHWLPDGCDHESTHCPDHVNPPCTEPGSNRHNPYHTKEKSP